METIETIPQKSFDTLAQIAGGYCVARCLHVIAETGIASQLNDTPRTAADLAAEAGVNPHALGRILRLLSAHGIFEASGDAFRHSPASRLLRTDHAQSMSAFAQMFGLPVFWRIYGQLGYSLQTGRPAAEKVIPEGLWTYFGQHPEANTVFNAAMASKAFGQVAGVVAAYDFSNFKLIGDIGGGRGHLLKAILEESPSTHGVLFDLPNVVKEAKALASERLRLEAGDFFQDPVPVCDAYLLMEIIHDWPDGEALAILRAIRKAAPPHAKLLIIEQMISAEAGPHWSKMLDIHMLTLLGGRQRSLPEYQILLEEAGFTLEREIPTFSDVSILEALPA